MTVPLSSLRNSPGLIWAGFKIVRRSGLKLPALFAAFDVLAGVLIAVELLLIRSITEDLLGDSVEVSVTGLVLFGVVTAVRRVLLATANQLKVIVGERVEWSLVHDVISVAAVAPFEEFENPTFHDRLRRALGAASSEAWNVVYSLLRLTNSGVTSLSLIIVMITVAPELLLPFLVAAIALVVVATFQGRIRYKFEYLDTPRDRERVYLREALISRSEGREARLFGARRLLIDRHEDLQRARMSELRRMVRRSLASELVGVLVLAGALVGVFAVIAVRARDGDIAVADAAVAALTAQQLTSAIQTMVGSVGTLHQSTLFLGDLISFIEDPPPVPPDQRSTRSADAIVLHDVTYQYPDTASPAVSNLDLRIEAGEVVALVGENGAGKSTVAKLLCGLYAPTSGSLEVEGGNEDPVGGPLTGLVSAVFQDFARYDLTVSENVWLGAPWRSEREVHVEEALAKSGAASILRNLPNGVGSLLGRRFETGLDLSIGQWQRLALARAFYSPAPFLVLDEPTASLDPKVEADLFDRLHELCAGRGVLLISHRFSTVRSADRIVVMDEGRVAETGTHESLMDADGVYAALYRLQADRYQH